MSANRSARGFESDSAKPHSFFALRTIRVVTRANPNAVGLRDSKGDHVGTTQRIRLTVIILIACTAFAQSRPSQGETAPKTEFVVVQPDVKLKCSTGEGADAISYFLQAAEVLRTYLKA